MRPFVLSLLLCIALEACAPGRKELPPRDASDWTKVAQQVVPELDSLLLVGFDPMGDWRLERGLEADWSLLAVTPEARGTWRLSLRRSASSESSSQVLSAFQRGVLILSHPLELAPGEEVRALFHVLCEGREFFVPDTRLARLVPPDPLPDAGSPGFQRVPTGDPVLPSGPGPGRTGG